MHETPRPEGEFNHLQRLGISYRELSIASSHPQPFGNQIETLEPDNIDLGALPFWHMRLKAMAALRHILQLSCELCRREEHLYSLKLYFPIASTMQASSLYHTSVPTIVYLSLHLYFRS